MARERWGSKLLFIFAAVGSAAGLGNLWRFPYLAYKYGGGAFLIPYLVILLFVGAPLLLLEFSLGQRFQKGAIEGMYGVNRNFAGVGLMGILAGFIISGYYAVVMSWAVIFLVNSLNVAWAGNEISFFYDQVLNISGGIENIVPFRPSILVALVAIWLGIYFSIWKSAKSASKVVMVTMPLPILLVIILAIRGITLGEGSLVGIHAYLVPKLEALFDVEVWHAAISQIFFTLTLGFGTMIAYGSYNDENQELVKATYWTVFLNSSISIIAGFAVFGTIGFMSYNLALEKGVPQEIIKEFQKQRDIGQRLDQKETYTFQELQAVGIEIDKKTVARHYLDQQKLAGPGLAFVVYPKAIAMFKPPWIAATCGFLFFITLISLGIDSAFSLVEAFSTAIADEMRRHTAAVNHSILALIVCAGGFLQGVLYSSQGGLYLLDLVDHYVTNYNLVIVGLVQAVALGWFSDIGKHRSYINSTTNLQLGKWWEISIKFAVPATLIYLLVNQAVIDINRPYGGYVDLAQIIGWAVVVLPLLFSVFLCGYMRMSRSEHAGD